MAGRSYTKSDCGGCCGALGAESRLRPTSCDPVPRRGEPLASSSLLAGTGESKTELCIELDPRSQCWPSSDGACEIERGWTPPCELGAGAAEIESSSSKPCDLGGMVDLGALGDLGVIG
eukprot:CAMPEP_0206268058 /NCGR_PEP_ID=MMETSP0047_2-20121206/31494_1 /ASSEMBLY_ACC=CAM_ASM_000192 /TAXON_ID=195065 /ORGANISM="Chroomonas mesostigmatica_cf, Strain CCMP1168" /LENGTH=118 /DNA_ID=CAMNT_0053696331 /DNA_START=122 /DNA_END=478 /DNA_ORIENTATION=+